LQAGHTLAIVGKSGSGKTTLLKCIYGLEDLTSGSVTLEGETVLGPAYNLIPGHEQMKLVSQDYYVLDNHTVAENIYDKMIGFTDEAKQKRALKLLNLLELSALKDTRARNLSSGQKQRVAIARALAVFPRLLLLDEPFSNLDHLLTEKLFTFVTAEARKQKTAVILITHLGEEALKYADTIAVMDNGRITQQGEKWNVYYNPRNSRLAGLLGGYNLLKREDLMKRSKTGTGMVVRPDKLIFTDQSKADISLLITSCSYNGKCFEVLCETATGRSVLIYSSQRHTEGKKTFAKIVTDHLGRRD
jgi:ABC-type Fe3+/spermidine/putrescine transport system ATPase subunit